MTTWPESGWHAATKARLARHLTATTETPLMGPEGEERRADVLCAGGLVVELQHGYLSAEEIRAREAFYCSARTGTGLRPDLIWLYDGALIDGRLHRGARGGYWLKNGSKSWAAHSRPVYVDLTSQAEGSPHPLGILWLTDISNVAGRGGRGQRVVCKGRWFSTDEWLTRVAGMAGQGAPKGEIAAVGVARMGDVKRPPHRANDRGPGQHRSDRSQQ